MNIRKAKVSDIGNIKSLADALVVRPNDLGKTTGFYDYSLTENQYLRRVESPFFFVAESQEGFEGFCMAYDSEFVRKLIEQEPQLREDAIFDYLNHLNEDYVYIDQLAVRELRTIRGGLTACNLINRIIDETRTANIHSLLCAIAHKPWENISALKLAEKSGFKLQQEIDSKGILLGIYQLTL